MNMATTNIPTPIRTVSTTRPPAMVNRPLGPHWVSFETPPGGGLPYCYC